MSYKENQDTPKRQSNSSSYGDGDIPEIDTTQYHNNATNIIPDEVPRRGGPGGN